MGFFDRTLFDFNGDGETDFMEWSIGMQMTASSRQESIDLTGDEPVLIREGNISLETILKVWRNE